MMTFYRCIFIILSSCVGQYMGLCSMELRGPDFMLIGAAKSGTTSLHNYITQHPMIQKNLKEISYFYTPHYQKATIEQYLGYLRPYGNELLAGDASVIYLHHENSPKLLSKHYPDVKIIVILRNPIDRAFSHYKFVVGKVQKINHKKEFVDLITSELSHIKNNLPIDESHFTYSNVGKYDGYVLSGRYVVYLKRWMEYFSREQFLILNFDDLVANPQEVMSQVFKFLQLPNYENIEYTLENPSELKIKIPEIARQMLEEFYYSYNIELEKLLDMEFRWNE